MKCPNCGTILPDNSDYCRGCGQFIEEINKWLRRRALRDNLIKLLPLIILIAINIPAIIGLVHLGRDASDTSGLSGQAGLMAVGAGLAVLALTVALIVFDVIYLLVWLHVSGDSKDNNDSSST